MSLDLEERKNRELFIPIQTLPPPVLYDRGRGDVAQFSPSCYRLDGMSTPPVNGIDLALARSALAKMGGKACYRKHGKSFYKAMTRKASAARSEKARLRALEKERAEANEAA